MPEALWRVDRDKTIVFGERALDASGDLDDRRAPLRAWVADDPPRSCASMVINDERA
jgi:hypothetical protein